VLTRTWKGDSTLSAHCQDNCPVHVHWHVSDFYTDGWLAMVKMILIHSCNHLPVVMDASFVPLMGRGATVRRLLLSVELVHALEPQPMTPVEFISPYALPVCR